MKILVLPGDGIGPEITEATLAVLDRTNAKFKLDLFANIRPAKSRMGVGLTGKPVDLVIFRECTEGFYADRNMFGDILSDEASEISGSLGLAGSVMAGDEACCAQAQHGSAPDIQGQDKANPTSLILSAAMLLEWLAARHKRSEFEQAAKAIEAAIDASLKDPATRTADLGGKLGTQAFGKHIASRVG